MTEASEQEVLEQEGQQAEQVDPQAEQKQAPDNHISKEDWIAKGNDPDKWRSPEVFEERGQLIQQVEALKHQSALDRQNMDAQRQDTDIQIRNLNQLHNATLQQTIADLESRRTAAVEDADAQAVDAIQKQIDHAKIAQVVTQPAQPQVPNKEPAQVEWE